MSSAVDPNARILDPKGLPLAIIILSSIFLVFSIVTVGLRTYIRLRKGTFGLDDGFMLAGTIVYIAVVGLAIYGVLVGLGTLEKDLNLWMWSEALNLWMWSEALKYYIIWILMYVVALALVKSSVCMTIQRIASMKKNLLITVWVLLGLTWASFLVTFVGTLLYCRPVEALWTPTLILSGEGSCAAVDTLVIIGHVATVSTIVTDMALVVVPGIILWNTQMKKQAKLQAFGLLSFASVASIITMVRIPYVNKFAGQTNLQFWVAHTMLCSNIETGIGCIASSIPTLRQYFRNARGDGSSGPSSNKKTSGTRSALFTFGSKPRDGSFYRRSASRSQFKNPTDVGFSLSTVQRGRGDDGDWERLQDGDSDKGILPTRGSAGNDGVKGGGIYAKHSYTVDVEDTGAPGRS